MIWGKKAGKTLEKRRGEVKGGGGRRKKKKRKGNDEEEGMEDGRKQMQKH